MYGKFLYLGWKDSHDACPLKITANMCLQGSLVVFHEKHSQDGISLSSVPKHTSYCVPLFPFLTVYFEPLVTTVYPSLAKLIFSIQCLTRWFGLFLRQTGTEGLYLRQDSEHLTFFVTYLQNKNLLQTSAHDLILQYLSFVFYV